MRSKKMKRDSMQGCVRQSFLQLNSLGTKACAVAAAAAASERIESKHKGLARLSHGCFL